MWHFETKFLGDWPEGSKVVVRCRPWSGSGATDHWFRHFSSWFCLLHCVKSSDDALASACWLPPLTVSRTLGHNSMKELTSFYLVKTNQQTNKQTRFPTCQQNPALRSLCPPCIAWHSLVCLVSPLISSFKKKFSLRSCVRLLSLEKSPTMAGWYSFL